MSTRDGVLESLLAAEGWVSGTDIAALLGVSRVAVGKHVEALLAAGYVIEAKRAVGYRLVSPPQQAVPAGVQPLLTSGFWTCIEGGEATGSTNDDARALARAGAAEGSVVVAASQTEGRGRLGRTWSSPSGGAYISVVLRPPVAPAEIGTLGLAVGLGVARALASLGVETSLKWPNDILLGGRKVAGILLEMSAEADRVEWVVAGIGVNVRREGGAVEDSACVGDALPDVSPARVAAGVLDGIAAAYIEWLREGFVGMQSSYEALNAVTGTQVTVRDISGSVLAAGLCEGTDSEGRLLVLQDGLVRRLSTGDVTLRG